MSTSTGPSATAAVAATPVVRHADARSAACTSDDPEVVLGAFKTVLQYTLTEVFGLGGEEVLWIGYHLDLMLAPLKGLTPAVTPLAVRQELFDGVFSRGVSDFESGSRVARAVHADPSVASAPLEDWVGVLMTMIDHSYRLRPMTQAAMTGQLTGLLRELGVGDPTAPRASLFIPMDVRDRLIHRADAAC